jgi:hypothetical protein
MIQNIPATHVGSISLADSFERYLQDKGKGRGGDVHLIVSHSLVRFLARSW